MNSEGHAIHITKAKAKAYILHITDLFSEHAFHMLHEISLCINRALTGFIKIIS